MLAPSYHPSLIPLRVSYRELDEATDGFSSNNLLGSGGYGTVYKGKLKQVQKPVAVKVLDLQRNQACKSLAAECNALRNVRHRNLVKVVSFCSSLDNRGNEFKALVFEYMENGSLADWLHQHKKNLSMLQRLNIVIDVATALHYLHDLCEIRIVHCDLKPSNVLLDGEMVAHVSDFGQARLRDDPISQNSCSSTVVVKGTVGYAAPEYGMGRAVWEQGDVYSFGILMLEMFTMRRPTDGMFRDGMNLHEYVKAAALVGKLGMIIDPFLLMEEERGDEERDRRRTMEMEMETEEKIPGCLASVLEIGVACSAESPSERMRVADVTRRLESIRDQLLCRCTPT